MQDAIEKYINKPWLAVRFSHLGDVLLTTGVLAHWCEISGKKISVLTSKDMVTIYENNPCIDKVYSLDLKRVNFKALVQSFRLIAGECEDMHLIDLHCNLRTMILKTLWKGTSTNYNKMSLARRIFLSTGSEYYRKMLREYSVTQRYAMAMANVPPEAKKLRPKIWLTDAEKTQAVIELEKVFGKGVRPLAVHPYATHSQKTLPEHRWKELLGKLDAQKVPWLIIGRGSSMFENSAQDFTNKCSLRESAALLYCCRCLITGDSGPMHLASAVGIPVVALFGPTTKEWGFYPCGDNDVVLEKELPCRPCSLHGKSRCKNVEGCLAGISTEDILAAVLKLS